MKKTTDEGEETSEVASDQKEEGGTGEGESKKEEKSGASKEEGKEEKGIPNFWLTAMKNAEMLEPMMKVCVVELHYVHTRVDLLYCTYIAPFKL